MIESIDKTYLRKLRKEAFLCNANCCDSPGNHEQVQMCVTNCEKKIVAAEQNLSQELQLFQQRLQRCTYACKDEVESKAAPNLDASGQAKLQAEFDKCAMKCVDDSIATLGPMKKRLEASLSTLL